MRLIDAGAVLAALSIFNDHTNGNEHFLNGIMTANELIADAPTVEAIPLVPLARWLAGYALPPGLKARKIVGKSSEEIAKAAEDAWVEFLHGMEWEDE